MTARLGDFRFRTRRMICGSLCLFLAAPVFAETPTLNVGYRIDARPFSYCLELDDKRDEAEYIAHRDACKEPQTRDDKRFRGFIVEICEHVIDELGVEVVRRGVDAGDRFEKLLSKDRETGIDILCDSTSVTPSRSAEYLFSPLVFVSGVSYAVSPNQREVEENIYVNSGKLSTPKTPDQDLALCSDTTLKTAPVFRVGVLKGTTARDTIKKDNTKTVFKLRAGERVCIEEVDGGYATAVKEMCEDKRFSFFFGDRDMLKFYLEKYFEDPNIAPCDVELSRQFYSFEPYAISVDPSQPELYLKVQAKVFDFFSDPDRVQRAFEDNFGQQTKATPLLENLWRLNALGRL